MKTASELADALRVSAPALAALADEEPATDLDREAMGVTPWKLRRLALQLDEQAAQIEAKYEKLSTPETE